MPQVNITQSGSLYITVTGEMGILAEIWEYFSFKAEGYQYMPSYKSGAWDGRIRLFDQYKKRMLLGLVDMLIAWCEHNGYSYSKKLLITKDMGFNAQEFLKTQKLKYTPYDFQVDILQKCMTEKRVLVHSATASGKSFAMYLICKALLELDKKVVIIVPSTGLVEQMYWDFFDYNPAMSRHVDKLYSGLKKTNSNKILVSTWQSLQNMPVEFLKEYNAVIADEAHEWKKAKETLSLVERCVNAEYRLGFTGTIEKTPIGLLQLIGIFGNVHKAITARELIDRGLGAKLNVVSIMLNHGEKSFGDTYQDEIEYLMKHPKRNQFIVRLASKCDGNVIVLYRFVAKHGEILYNSIVHECPDRKVFFVDKNTSAIDRDSIRAYCEQYNNAIIVASFKTFEKGVNIKNLSYGIFAHPTKSNTGVLQSLGRLMRKHKDKISTFYDIGDKFQSRYNGVTGTSGITHTHFKIRQKMYETEKHTVKMVNLKI
jgi:superfamily II DNA or RNA helicase